MESLHKPLLITWDSRIRLLRHIVNMGDTRKWNHRLYLRLKWNFRHKKETGICRSFEFNYLKPNETANPKMPIEYLAAHLTATDFTTSKMITWFWKPEIHEKFNALFKTRENCVFSFERIPSKEKIENGMVVHLAVLPICIRHRNLIQI